MTRDLPSPELLRKLLRYEVETGKLFWRNRTPDTFIHVAKNRELVCQKWNQRCAGKEAFVSCNNRGYKRGFVNGKCLSAQRVIWAIVTGYWPEHHVDHINGVRSDNRWINLREATSRQNTYNSRPHKRNTSGYKGVSWINRDNRWQAKIMIKGKNYNLGYFTSAKSAHEAYVKASKAAHGEFANNEKVRL